MPQHVEVDRRAAAGHGVDGRLDLGHVDLLDRGTSASQPAVSPVPNPTMKAVRAWGWTSAPRIPEVIWVPASPMEWPSHLPLTKKERPLWQMMLTLASTPSDCQTSARRCDWIELQRRVARPARQVETAGADAAVPPDGGGSGGVEQGQATAAAPTPAARP